MRDEPVVFDRMKRDQQRKMLERRGEIPTRSVKPRDALANGGSSFSPLDISGYVTGAANLDHAETAPPVMIGVMGHNGARNVARNSKVSYRGNLIFCSRQVQHESRIEKNVAQIVITWPELVNIWSQQPRVKYPDENGECHYHTFDYLVLLRDGRRIAISVKPESRRENEEAKLKQIVSVPQSQFDEAFVFTDAQATRTATFNARFILWSRKNANEDEIMAAREVMHLLPSNIFFWQLFDDGIPHHLRRAAIGKLIDSGEVVPIDPLARINDWCRLRVVHEPPHFNLTRSIHPFPRDGEALSGE
ncbi:hypothetical protein GFM09_34550 [Rhizobium leguminosarum bv. viciae]|uniref:hypothetical protein n=1 Tax=Rhizobium leguminosarum TaxID=384 RepID=UPI001441EFBC|nr:hypothetical protein [Rhizobium leguminosarum]NKL74263.1 hypothetical protein [Rhizobium leguminosarum bv. viciae]